MRVTGRSEDAFAFRTPSLRNVAKTGPWGHAGAYSDLSRFLRHHADPVAGLESYSPEDALLPELPGTKPDFAVMEDDALRLDIAEAAADRMIIPLSDAEISDLLAFLNALTDGTALAGRLGIPETVPSGLPIDR